MATHGLYMGGAHSNKPVGGIGAKHRTFPELMQLILYPTDYIARRTAEAIKAVSEGVRPA